MAKYAAISRRNENSSYRNAEIFSIFFTALN
jgi:hypothetical protein